LTISIIIPAHNEERYLPACLQSIAAHRSPRVIEVIVVDNVSTDRTAEIARGFPGVRVVREDKKGLSFARQRGFLEARGELLGYIDADCRMPANWCSIVERQFTGDPSLVSIGGMYSYYDLSPVQSVVIRSLWRVFGGLSYLMTSYMIVGGNFVARRTAIDRMGGFDTSIPFYGEDTDIARRLHAIGRVRFLPGFSVETSGRRWLSEGFVRTCVVYAMNFLWEALFKRPFSMTYNDIR
jgi:glycosyltransferase involved in cell wall biosynthesis